MTTANFLVPENTNDAHVIDEAQVDATTAISARTAVHRGPIGDIAVVDGAVLVTNYGDDTIALLDRNTLAARGVVAVPGEPVGVVVSDDRAYVSTSSSSHDAVSVIDTAARTVIATYPLAFSVTALAVSPNGKRVYAGRVGDDYADIAVIDTTAERIGTIDVATGAGAAIDALTVDAAGTHLYAAITDADSSALVVVDVETAAVKRTIRIGAPIRDFALVDGAAYVLTSDRSRGGVVEVIDVASAATLASIELGIGSPTQMAMSADGTRAYIVDYDRVMVLCTMSHAIVDTISVDARPSCVAVEADGGRLHVADYAGDVTAFLVASTLPELCEDFIATDPIYALRELAPAAV